MSNIIKGLFKLQGVLDTVECEKLESLALQYAKFHRIYFRVIAVNTENRELVVSAQQEKHSFANAYLTAGELIGKAKALFSPFFDDYNIKASATAYNSPKCEEITPERLQTLLQQHKLRIKDLHDMTGLDVSNLSMWVNGKRPMSNIVKNMFYFLFLSLDKRN